MKAIIPYHDDINRFLASTSLSERTKDPLFYCLRLQKNDDNVVYKPPFRRGFYFVGLLTNAEKSKISYDNTDVNNLDSLLVFQAPGMKYNENIFVLDGNNNMQTGYDRNGNIKHSQ